MLELAIKGNRYYWIFEKNYKGYLEAFTGLDLSIRCLLWIISVRRRTTSSFSTFA